MPYLLSTCTSTSTLVDYGHDLMLVYIMCHVHNYDMYAGKETQLLLRWISTTLRPLARLFSLNILMQ